jgi:hypothetical protein
MAASLQAIVFALASVGFAVAQNSVTTDAAAHAVLSTILQDSRCTGDKQENRPAIMLVRETINLNRQGWWVYTLRDLILRNNTQWFPKRLQSQTLDAFVQSNQQPGTVPAIERLLSPLVQPISENDLSRLGKGPSYWDELYATFPRARGYVEVSQPAFNAEYTQGLAYCGRSFGMLGGVGYVILFEKQNDHWTALGWQIVWES